MSDVNKILEERGKEYGNFAGHAKLTQRMKAELRSGLNWYYLSHAQRESAEMILHKISRIVNGNPNNVDSWQDIAGYATLVVNELREE